MALKGPSVSMCLLYLVKKRMPFAFEVKQLLFCSFISSQDVGFFLNIGHVVAIKFKISMLFIILRKGWGKRKKKS